jgi:uncharacterized protein
LYKRPNVTDHSTVLALARAAEASLEANRARLDDLNVYPVPDGDTGTNMLLTVRAVVEALESTESGDRAELAETVAHAALLGARGNSGVILSQIVRGAADVLGAAEEIDAATVAQALSAASDAAYRAVREPAEGTMLTVIREVAAAAETADGALPEVVAALVARGDEAVARTREQLDVLREAGVVDAGGAGLIDVLRGLAAHLRGEPLPEAPAAEPLSAEAIHQEVSRYRYCTVYVVEGEGLDSHALEEALVPLGDSLLVVGDERALKVHVHTNDPGAALRAGTALGVLERVEIANMQVQTAQREERLSASSPAVERTTDVVAVVTGEGNRRLFESLGAAALVEGGETMNPSTEELLDGIERTSAPEAVVLANNPNVVLAAEQAARLARKPVQVVPSGSLPAGLAAMIAFDGARSAEDNAAEMAAVLADVATGSVTIASRRVSLNGLEVAKGAYLGLVGDEPVAGGTSFDPVAASVVERLLAEPRDVLTLLTGADEPELGALLARLAERHPEIELEVHPGGQPHYPLLLSAE